MTNFNNQKEEKRKILYGLELAYEKLLQFKKRKKFPIFFINRV